MSRRYPPLTPAEVRNILRARGFVWDRTTGSHEHWVLDVEGAPRCAVTVDAAVREFSVRLIKSMIRQSRLTRAEFYGATKKTAKRI
jgi:predicted RNA binding protein YcfA (HicA-like mRNA interferase family)